MSVHFKEAQEAGEALDLSLKIYRLLRNLEKIGEFEFTAQQRHAALQIVKDFADDIKVSTLATVVLKEVTKEDGSDDQH